MLTQGGYGVSAISVQVARISVQINQNTHSGTSLSAQTRYAAGTPEILECYVEGRPIRDEDLIVQGGQLASVGTHSYSKGNATGGSEEAAKFKKS